MSPDGNVSTTTVIFIPSESDQGKFLTCRAENMKMTGGGTAEAVVEDRWRLQVHCECCGNKNGVCFFNLRRRE